MEFAKVGVPVMKPGDGTITGVDAGRGKNFEIMEEEKPSGKERVGGG